MPLKTLLFIFSKLSENFLFQLSMIDSSESISRHSDSIFFSSHSMNPLSLLGSATSPVNIDASDFSWTFSSAASFEELPAASPWSPSISTRPLSSHEPSRLLFIVYSDIPCSSQEPRSQGNQCHPHEPVACIHANPPEHSMNLKSWTFHELRYSTYSMKPSWASGRTMLPIITNSMKPSWFQSCA